MVGAELSKKIEAAASQLGYVPSRTMRRNQGAIAVLVPHLHFGYFSEVLNEIIEQMPKYKCKVLILPITPGDDSYKSFFKDLYIHGVVYLDEDLDRASSGTSGPKTSSSLCWAAPQTKIGVTAFTSTIWRLLTRE